MNVDVIRHIDRIIGIPICFCLSLHHHCLKFINKLSQHKNTNENRTIKNILFIELSEMGSAIIAYSAMKQVQEAYPTATLHFLIFDKNKESVAISGLVLPSNIHVIRDQSIMPFILDTLRYLRLARKIKFDVIIDLELFSRCTAILAYLSGSPRRVGYYKYTHEGLYRGNLLTHNVYYNPHVHMSYNFHALAQSLIGNERFLPRFAINKFSLNQPKIDLNKTILSRFKSVIGTGHPIIILNPSPGKLLPIRNWGQEKFAQLSKELISKLKATIVLVGIKAEQDHADFIKAFNQQSSKIIDLTGKTASIYELIHVFALGNILITNDSGPAHFASLTDIITIVFFGPETPALYKPVSQTTIAMYEPFSCSPCLTAMNHRKTVCHDNRCLQAISVESVISVVTDSLKHSHH